MKKWLNVVLIFLILTITSNIEKKTPQTVMTYTKPKEYITKEITTQNITTKNIHQYFSKVKVLEVTCTIPKLYKNKIPLNNSYKIEPTKSLIKNMKELEKKHQITYQNNGYIKQSESIYFYGIPIKKIKVYGTIEEIKKIENNIIK